VTEDGGKQPLRVGAGERELVGVADAGGLYLHQHFTGFGPIELDVLDDERLARLVRHCCASLHGAKLRRTERANQ
jgi:hypothetical protein